MAGEGGKLTSGRAVQESEESRRRERAVKTVATAGRAPLAANSGLHPRPTPAVPASREFPRPRPDTSDATPLSGPPASSRTPLPPASQGQVYELGFKALTLFAALPPSVVNQTTRSTSCVNHWPCFCAWFTPPSAWNALTTPGGWNSSLF